MSEWLKDYLKDRQQYTVVNGKQSDYAKVTYRIPQGSVLCPILFTLYTNDIRAAAVTSGTVYLDYVHTVSFSLGFYIVLRPQGIRKQLKTLRKRHRVHIA